jgi:hypothetical protein
LTFGTFLVDCVAVSTSSDPRLHGLRAFRTAQEAPPADTALRAGIRRCGSVLSLRYVVAGTVPIRWPPPATAVTRVDRLWEHTCFEAFLAPRGGAAYWELNLSPSGDWNTYRFDGYREGMRPDPRAQAPAIGVEQASCGTLTVRATLDLGTMAELRAGPLDVSLAAVLEADDGTLSYWALRHTAVRPDFHRRDGFVLHLDGEGPA